MKIDNIKTFIRKAQDQANKLQKELNELKHLLHELQLEEEEQEICNGRDSEECKKDNDQGLSIEKYRVLKPQKQNLAGGIFLWRLCHYRHCTFQSTNDGGWSITNELLILARKKGHSSRNHGSLC